MHYHMISVSPDGNVRVVMRTTIENAYELIVLMDSGSTIVCNFYCLVNMLEGICFNVFGRITSC